MFYELVTQDTSRAPTAVSRHGVKNPGFERHCGLTSSDTRERAGETKTKWGLPNLKVGYGIYIDKARERGLYISTSRGITSAGIEEPPLFSEPGLFLVKPDRTLYWASVATMPFARPHFPEVAQAIEFVLSKDYPARGEA